jgi:hypothetical protein
MQMLGAVAAPTANAGGANGPGCLDVKSGQMPQANSAAHPLSC